MITLKKRRKKEESHGQSTMREKIVFVVCFFRKWNEWTDRGGWWCRRCNKQRGGSDRGRGAGRPCWRRRWSNRWPNSQTPIGRQSVLEELAMFWVTCRLPSFVTCRLLSCVTDVSQRQNMMKQPRLHAIIFRVVLPAFHFAKVKGHSPVGQGFLVEIFGVATDVRWHVVTFGLFFGFILSGKNKVQEEGCRMAAK